MQPFRYDWTIGVPEPLRMEAREKRADRTIRLHADASYTLSGEKRKKNGMGG